MQIPGKANINYSGTWDDLSITLLKSQYYEETFRRTNFLKSEIQNLKNIKDTMQCIQEAFDYVSKTLEWNNTVSVFSQTDAAKVFENKKGSATEINLILVSLLKAAGLNASPVIISTRSNGKISELYPSLNQFNYTIACVEVNGKDILMDATDRYTKPGMLPERCLNRTGRLIKREGSRFVSLEPTAISVKVETITASIDPGTGEIKGNLVTSNAGYNGHDIKESIKEEGEENIIKRIKKQNAEWEIENFKLENKEGAEEVKIIFDFRIPENVSTDIIYLNPLLSGKIVNNPFTEQNRIYPVDLTTGSDEVVISTIKIPEEYKVEELPVSVNVALPDNLGKFSYKIVNEGNSVKVMSRIKMNEYLFQPAEYDMLRNFYDNIVQKHAEQIVIKRVKK